MSEKAKNSRELFEGNAQQSAAYAKFRPMYSTALFDAIYDYAGASGSTDCALDVATGAITEDCDLFTNASRWEGAAP